MKHEGKKRYLTISEFSKISEISRKALIFYDNIGLFSPEYTAENGYRYYSHSQIYFIFAITILKELGTPLNQIKEYMKTCSPMDAVTLLETQDKLITSKIDQLRGTQDMLNSKLQKLKQGLLQSHTNVTWIHQTEQPIFISDPIEKKKDDVYDEEWVGFYMKCKERGIALGYPEGFLVDQKYLCEGQTDIAGHIICHVGDKKYANACMPEGNYVSVCGHGSFGDTEPLYKELLQYIQEQNLEISGHAYETRLIDEIASKDPYQQLMQICIQVK
ncbi:MAG: MerR family transcriptional regulator [Lachnospiraceae bacterium]|nr:MerR family transcriptional regulator [Lachnospiraceae bacterium]